MATLPNSNSAIEVRVRANPAARSWRRFSASDSSSFAVFSAAAALLPDTVAYQGREDLRFAIAEYTTSNYLDVAVYRVTAGRWFTGAEDGAGPVPAAVIMSDRIPC